MTSKAKVVTIDVNSKSLPPNQFPIINISSADSGIDSDSSSTNTSSKLTNSLEDVETDIKISRQTFLLGPDAKYEDRVVGINKALDWIKEELLKMKAKDKQLTKAMISIRSKIAEKKLLCEKHDTGYDSDSENRKKGTNRYQIVRRGLNNKDEAFPADGSFFENNKRATWAI